jgi:rhodanese-related sulfurtransferase
MLFDVIGPDTTMGEILDAYPSAKVALFQRYHIGGCQACGYALTDSLAKVIREHDIKESLDAIASCVRDSASLEAELYVTADELRASLARGETRPILDVRTEAEFEGGHIDGSQLLTVELTFDALDGWPKDTPIVFVSNRGDRSLQRANYFRSYGFTKTTSLMGGLEAWQQPTRTEPGTTPADSSAPRSR